MGCTNCTGNFQNNFFIQSPNSIILNTNGNATGALPSMIINSSGNIGIGTTNPSTILDVRGAITLGNNIWHNTTEGINRFYFNNNGTTFFHSANGNGEGFIFRNTAQGDIMTIKDNGNLITTGSITNGASSYLYAGGLRIGGSDIGNTVYNGSKNMGLTVDSGYTVTIGQNGGVGAALVVSNSGITISQPTTINNKLIVSNSIGINNATPLYDLDVNGFINCTNSISATGNVTAGSYITANSIKIGTGNKWSILVSTSYNYEANSLIFSHVDSGINSTWWFNGTQTSTNSEISDRRIKKNIQPILNVLGIINQVQTKSFNLIDDKDVNFKYGFLAQDIEQIPALSNLVFTSSNYIANINSYGNHSNINDNQALIICNNIITDLINIDDNIKLVFNNTSNQEFVIDDTPYNNRYKRRYANVIEIVDDYSFIIDIYLNLETDPFLIYGKKVNDFKQLDYQSFIALSICSIQELTKLINNQQIQIDYLTSNLRFS